MKSIYPSGAIIVLIFSIFALGQPQKANAQTESQGPFCGRNFASDVSNGGALYWTNASAARCDEDDTRTATDRLAQGQYTQYLHISDFGFSIPRDARITGIEVVVIRRSDNSNTLRDRSVKLVLGESLSSNKAVTEAWDSEWTAVYYGGENDLWGGQWTAYDLNRRDFGMVLDVECVANGGQPQVDEVLVTVHYASAGKNVQAVNVARAPSKFTCLNLGS